MKKLLYILSQPLLAILFVSSVYAQSINVPQPNTVTVNQLGNVIGATVGLLIIFAAVAAFLFLILGGLQWITSGGDKAGMETARNKITAAIVGLIIVAAAWAIMVLMGQFIGFNILGGIVNIPTITNPNPGVVPVL